MKSHEKLRDDDRDRATQYVLYGLDPDATLVYEAHLEICALCRGEVGMCRDGFETLGRSLPPVDPPATLKDRLMHRIRDGAGVQTWKQWQPNRPGDDIIVRAGESDWQPIAVDGVRVRRLFVDPAADRVTMLVRMDAGTAYPAHRHGGVEECFVLEGDLYGPDFEMKAGDYQRLEGGSTHGVQGTRAGCLLFLISSMHDEFLPNHA